jgi:hypothetical protein
VVSKQEDKSFCSEWQQVFPVFSLLLISLWKVTIVDVIAAAAVVVIVAAAAVLCFQAGFWCRYFDTVRLLSLLCPSMDGHRR